MDKEKLLELRSKIVEKTQQLAVNGQGSPEDRLQVLFNIIQSGGASLEVLSSAYELIESLNSDDEKLTALLDVLYEVDARISEIPENTVPSQPEQQHQEVENQSHDNNQQ